MQLGEQGKFLLTDPVHLCILVPTGRSRTCGFTTVDLTRMVIRLCRACRSITIKDLLTHTDSPVLTTSISNKVDEIYYKEGYTRPCGNIQFAQRLAKAPLLFQPGDAFVYGFNSDVVGALVEVLSGSLWTPI